MKFEDMLFMSLNNLKRRRLRTFLTVLGVVIGTGSIVVMISLGLGLQKRSRELVESSGSLTTIQVMELYGGDNGREKPKQLTDEAVKAFLNMDHVKSVFPILQLSIMLRQGAYEASYITLNGVSREYLDQIPIQKNGKAKVGEGLRLIYGNEILKSFTHRKTGKGFYETNKLPEVDLMRKPMFVIFDMDGYYGAQADEKIKPPKKYLLEAEGIVDETKNKNFQYSYSVYADMDLLKEQLKRIFKKKPIPGQPTTKKGKAYPYFVYNTIEVNVDNVKHVREVQKKLNEAGYQASSNIEWLEQTEKQSGMIQAVLGGIGAVSLVVAAIGIANTMMMSIYERTKEIGVLKVLGCDLGDIRNMFLMESAFIGFLGGVTGVALSYGISYAMNHLLKLESMGMGEGGAISQIPWWLSLSAMIFSVLVGMAAGFFPALRAMSLSPLAAIRNE